MINHLPQDIGNNVIQGINNFADISNYELTVSGEWIPITLNTEGSLQILLQPRDRIDWYISTISGGAEYFSPRDGAALQAPIVTTSGTIICWVSADQPTVFELLSGS